MRTDKRAVMLVCSNTSLKWQEHIELKNKTKQTQHLGPITSELNLMAVGKVQNLTIFKSYPRNGYIDSQVENP